MNLVLVVCFAASPLSCHERLLAAEDVTAPIACLSAAPAAIAEWSANHPDWTVARWRCEPLDRRARQ